MGSRGSYPLIFKTKAYWQITITDKNMTRFNISLEQGVNYVIECLNKMVGGELFVPKLYSFKILDLAKAMASV